MPTRAKPRRPLSRERILRAALELADQDGVESITMRKLAGGLGFEAMSLYNHVASKDDVINGILDLVLAEGELPTGDGDWATAIRESAISVHAALRRHPWACSALIAPRHVRAARLRYMDALLGRLRHAGFSAETTYHAYHVLDGHIFGFSLWETAHTYSEPQMDDVRAVVDRLVPQDEYPHLREHAIQHLTEGPHREVSAFEFGLDLILAGLKDIAEPLSP